MEYGYHNSILRVDLTEGKIAIEQRNEDFFRRYYGGVCMIGHILMKELQPGVDPFSPDNLLVFAPGVVTGATIAGGGRHAVGAKSPLTGGFGKSEAGGFWGAELKRAGFDLVVIKGRAKKPVYISITDKNVAIKEAGHLWGRTTKEVQELLKRELGGNCRIAQIGPAGERLVRFAAIIHDLKHVAGRTGLGAVMGSKNLRAIAVKGSKKVETAHPEQLLAIQKEISAYIKTDNPKLHLYGTGHDMDAKNAIGNVPTRNFSECFFEKADSLSAVVLKEAIPTRMETCFACPVSCKKAVTLSEPFEVDPAYGGPEYETLAAMGNNCGVGDLNVVVRAHHLCNAYGLDTLSTGVTISFAMECYEKGIISDKDTDGLQLKFGNGSALLELIEKITLREGIGDILANGSKRAAEQFGRDAEKLAVHVKGLEMAMHEPRLKAGLGLGYVVASHGADHGTGMHDTDFVKSGRGMDAVKALGHLDFLPAHSLNAKKVRLFSDLQKWRNFNDSLVTCYFPLHTIRIGMFSKLAEIVHAVTGWDTTVYEGMRVGERAITLARLFNLREGFSKEQDSFPPKMYKAFDTGALKGVAFDKETVDKAIKNYYREMGWDESTGVPLQSTLEALGLD